MFEAEQTRMQSLARKCGDLGPNLATARDAASGTRAVYRIADQRVSAMGKMYPNLMRSAGGKAAFDECCPRVE